MQSQVLGQFESPSTEQNCVDSWNVVRPCKFEDLTVEVQNILKLELFEGFYFTLINPPNPSFFVRHAINMGNKELSIVDEQIIKAPVGTYEFELGITQRKFSAVGQIFSDGKFVTKLNYNVNNWLGCQLQSHFYDNFQTSMMMDVDVKAKDWKGQLKLGSGEFVEVNYMQSITEEISAGGELFYLGSNGRSGSSLAIRHASPTHAAAFQMATTGLAIASYWQRVSDKIRIASELVYNWKLREAITQVGYEYIAHNFRLRGRIDSNGCISSILEERLFGMVNFILCGEVNLCNQNYKFGFGLIIGK